MTPSSPASQAALWALASVVLHLAYCVFRRSEITGRRFLLAYPVICLTVSAGVFVTMFFVQLLLGSQ